MINANFLKYLCCKISVLSSQNNEFELVGENKLFKLLFSDNFGLDPKVILNLYLNFVSIIECHKAHMQSHASLFLHWLL